MGDWVLLNLNKCAKMGKSAQRKNAPGWKLGSACCEGLSKNENIPLVGRTLYCLVVYQSGAAVSSDWRGKMRVSALVTAVGTAVERCLYWEAE